MQKEEVISLMCHTVESINREIAKEMFLKESQVEEILNNARPQLEEVNTKLYNTLVEYGIIR
jgi:hypothetical protein